MELVKVLRELSKGFGDHKHIVYINDDAKIATCSPNEEGDHSHEVQFLEAQEYVPPQYDELGNIIQDEIPAREGGWYVMPGADGHTHEIKPIAADNLSVGKETTEQIVNDVYQSFYESSEIEEESILDGVEAEEYYFGKQWSDSDVSTLNEQGRAALTINLIQPKMDELSGHEREQRTDFRFLPVEDGDQRVCDILNVVVKVITDQCGYPIARSNVFLDQAVVGRGIFNLDISYEDDLRGEVKIEHFPWQDVRFGPHLKQDLSDCEFVHKHRMVSKQYIQSTHPDVKDEIEAIFQDRGALQVDNTQDQGIFGDRGFPLTVNGLQNIDMVRKQVRLIECWRKIYLKTTVLAQPDDDFYVATIGWAKKDIDLAKQLPGFQDFPGTVKKMRITRIAGGVLLSDDFPADLAVDDFHVVPVYAHKRGHRFWGKVSQAIDPQKELNKRHSQAIDIGNKAIAAGWFYDANTFPATEKEKFKRIGTTPGFVVEINEIERPPVKVESGVIPPVIVDLMNISEQRLNQLLNTTVEPQGANDSGSKILQLERQRLLGNEYLFDHLDFAEKRIGKLLVAMIQKYFTPDRIYRIVSQRNAQNPVMVGGEEMSNFSEEEIVDLIANTDISKFDVVVGQATYSPTVRLANFMLLSDLAGKGLPIPPDVLIELMDIPSDMRTRIMSGMQAQSDAASQAELAKSQAEVDKSLISKGLIPPEVAQNRLGQQMGQQPQMPDEQMSG